MARITPEGPNAQQIEYWNEISGDKWVAMNDVIDAQIEPLGSAAIDHAGVRTGERVLDVGCGCGQTTLQLAARVGSTGAVRGVDISAPMLARAQERVDAAGAAHVELDNVDAQTTAFDPEFDLVFSRFGVMFFAEPERAFANLLSALRPGGRLTWVTWQALPRNPWMLVPVSAAAKHLPPMDPPDPEAPGPFALADADRTERLLAAAGFEDIAHGPLERELLVGGGGDLDETVGFVLQLGPLGAALREAAAEVRAAAAHDVRTALEPYFVEGADGRGVRMPAAAWLVTAKRPA
ncbi:MAG: class I SAM-dependent methyltransferase [Myxococcales bacterium]|nr:class I SAM-dependent methyltransferase [Myxococcales bacterium]